MICLDCEAVFPSTNVECPSCKKESHLLLQLSNEDLGKIEKQIEHLKQTGRTQTALTLSRDLLSMIPSSDVARKSIGELEETERRGKTGKTLEELETRAKEAWEKDRYSLARKYLLEYRHIAPLAPESKAILEEASLRIRKGKKRTVRFLFILGGIFLLAGVAAGVAGTMSHSPECFLCGFCLLIAGLLLLPIAGIYLYLVKKKYKMDPGQKSLHKT